MITCNLTPNPLTQSHSLEDLLPADRDRLLRALASQLSDSVRAADQHLGHLEEQLLRGGHELSRQMLEKAAQQKADAAPPICPHCRNKLRRLTAGHRATIQSRFGPLQVTRARGYCKRCHKWRFPADALLDLSDQGTQSPAVQEIAALTVSQMPAAQAEHLVERLTGLKISVATLARQAHHQGQRAQAQRTRLDQQMNTPEGLAQQARDLQLQLALEPFTLIIELDAWNIRERDDWDRAGKNGRRAKNPPAGIGCMAAPAFA